MAGKEEACASIKVKHGKITHEFDALELETSVDDFKAILQSMTDVPADMMKLVHKGKSLLTGSLSSYNIKDKTTLMLMGNPKEAVIATNTIPEGLPEVFDDWDLDYMPSAEEIEHHQDSQRKLHASCKATVVHFINEPRQGKRVLVLDLDHCLLHFSRTLAEEGREAEMKRPFMDEFLEITYQYYDLVIWSQTHWQWVEQKLTALGMLTHPGYKICFVLDREAMFKIGVRNPKRSRSKPDEFVRISVKPLELVWTKLKERFGERDGEDARGAQNTVQIDDLSRNFSMNPQNGLRCSPFNRKDGKEDKELIYIAQYLALIAQKETDFRGLDHGKWVVYLSANKGLLPLPPSPPP